MKKTSPANPQDQVKRIRKILIRNVDRLLSYQLRPDAIADAHMAIALGMAMTVMTRDDVSAWMHKLAEDIDDGPEHGCAGSA